MILRPSRRHGLAFGGTLIFAFLCVGRGGGAEETNETESIAWRDDYSSALEEARTANRLLWIQFTGPWCPNCTRMERESFPHPVVVQHTRESFVPLKLQSDAHEQLAHNFNLSALPATIIVAPDRSVVAIHQGYLGPAEFDAFLRDCLSRLPGKDVKPGTAMAQAASRAEARHDTAELENEDRPALDGYCAVSLIRDRKLVAGECEYSSKHDGRTYRFASRENRDLFRAEPDRYVPANSGSCPVTQLEKGKVLPGSPKWGILYMSHLFLFASEGDRRRFTSEPDRYAMVDVAEQGFCMHCIRESGLLVRGNPSHEIARAGRRYWFPDASHRDAFLTSVQ
jgi:YHS domain-containing protein